MWLQALQLLNPAGLIKGILKDREHKRTLKNTIKQKQIERAREGRVAEAEWNVQALKQAGWKDEWLTVLVSIPLIGAFFPTVLPHITSGFIALETMPVWYQGAIGLVFSAAFGSQAYQKFSQTNFRNKMNKAYTLP